MAFRTFRLTIAILLATAAAVAQTATVSNEPPAAAVADEVVDRILTRLEARRVESLHAQVRWELEYTIAEEDEPPDTKLGDLWYQEGAPVARFKAHFRAKLADGVRRPLDEQHLFDGNWYIELQAQTKTITRREVRAADDRRNPYKLGEGAFPVPFGQKKADILREFEVVRVAPAANDPPGADHLRLRPRSGTHTGERYESLSFWVAREGDNAGLPVKVRAAKKDGTGKVNSNITLTFSDIRANEPIAADVFEIVTPPGFQEIVERLEAGPTAETVVPAKP